MQLARKIVLAVVAVFLLAVAFVCFEVYVPLSSNSHQTVIFSVRKGWSDEQIADNLQKAGIIRSAYFFKFYAILTLRHPQLKAGEYALSPSMSIYQISNKMASGNVIRDKVVILEGWDTQDIGEYLESKGVCKQDGFVLLAKKDYSLEFDFLSDKPKSASLEGYLFPDTYEISQKTTCEDILSAVLSNFGKKLTPWLREEIKSQGKSIFDIITMASLIEKEVITFEDKEIVSGILWKRLAISMPLQVDATIVYITGRASISASDKKVDSPYNTYKYYGLPAGPIANPGIDSIKAAIYPKQTEYWYYLTDGKTIFSETLEEHNEAKARYLK